MSMLQRKEYVMNMLGNIPHQKFHFYHLPTRGRAGISLGMLICLQRIYNFLLFHDVILSFLDVLQSFYGNSMERSKIIDTM